MPLPQWMIDAGGKPNPQSKRRVTSVPQPLGEGVGTELMAIFKEDPIGKHATSCPNCIALARRMNEWDSAGCIEHLDEIVEDILPRAKDWLQSAVDGKIKGYEPTALDKLKAASPYRVKRIWIKRQIKQAIRNWESKSKVRAAPKPQADEASSDAKPEPDAEVAKRNVNRRPGRLVKPLPFTYADEPIEPVDLSQSTRHLVMHVYPVKGNGVWQWNLDQVMKHADLFNGLRIVSIVTDYKTESAAEVRQHLVGFADEVLEFPNQTQLGEVVSFAPMVQQLLKHDSPTDVTFYCHTKGVTRNKAPAIRSWASAMYETCLHWPAVQPLLESHAMAGSFRRYAHVGRDWGDWHYSGTFWWFRNADVFTRDWTRIPQRRVGIEAWPSRMFRENEVGCIFLDRTGGLYDPEYWEKLVTPALEKWRREHSK